MPEERACAALAQSATCARRVQPARAQCARNARAARAQSALFLCFQQLKTLGQVGVFPYYYYYYYYYCYYYYYYY